MFSQSVLNTLNANRKKDNLSRSLHPKGEDSTWFSLDISLNESSGRSQPVTGRDRRGREYFQGVNSRIRVIFQFERKKSSEFGRNVQGAARWEMFIYYF